MFISLRISGVSLSLRCQEYPKVPKIVLPVTICQRTALFKEQMYRKINLIPATIPQVRDANEISREQASDCQRKKRGILDAVDAALWGPKPGWRPGG